MSSSYSRYQVQFHSLFFISIIIVSLQACVSPPYASKSPQYSASNRPLNHKVEVGDTLFSIAWRYGFKYQDLAKYNGISAPYKIYPAQIIRLNIPLSRSAKFTSPQMTANNTPAPRSGAYSKNNSSKYKTAVPVKDEKVPLQYGAVVWQWPSSGSILMHFLGATTLNKGIDINGKLGEPVFAAASGQVVYAGSGLRGYGKLLIIKHNDTFLSAYAHNNKLLVGEGDLVKVGQKVADMGSSGTDGVKLHFEIRRDGTPENPLKYLPKR